MIFLDTSVIYALADQADPEHENAKGRMQAALESGEEILTHNFLVMRRRGVRTAMAFDRDFEEEGFKLFPAGAEQPGA